MVLTDFIMQKKIEEAKRLLRYSYSANSFCFLAIISSIFSM